jgi:hypothetical protein
MPEIGNKYSTGAQLHMLAKLFNIFVSITHLSKESRKETKNDVNAERRKYRENVLRRDSSSMRKRHL